MERFNRTLKTMLKKFIDVLQHWDKLRPSLLFAVCEVPQASMGFSPFELVYGRQPRGILDLLRETWEKQESRGQRPIYYNFGNVFSGSEALPKRIYCGCREPRNSNTTDGQSYGLLSPGTGFFSSCHPQSPSYSPSGKGCLR